MTSPTTVLSVFWNGAAMWSHAQFKEIGFSCIAGAWLGSLSSLGCICMWLCVMGTQTDGGEAPRA